MKRTLLLLASIVLAGAGCGQGSPTGETGARGSSTLMSQSAASGLSEMLFRPAEPGERILAPLFTHPQGHYAIRPPAGWSRTAPGAGSSAVAAHRALFRNPTNGDFLDIGVMNGGPRTLTQASLTALKDTMAQGLRAAGGGDVIATDAFRFGPLCAVQTMANRQGTIVIHLLVFRKPGQFLQVVYAINQTRYRAMARSVEASLASLAWP